MSLAAIKARVEALAEFTEAEDPAANAISDQEARRLRNDFYIRREQALRDAAPEAIADRAELVAMIEEMAEALQKLIDVCEPVQPLLQAANVKAIRWAAKFMGTLDSSRAALAKVQS